MGKWGEFMISEKTKVTLNIATLIVVVGFAFKVAFFISDTDSRLGVLEEHDQVYLETQRDLAEIKTDLKWIRAALAEGE